MDIADQASEREMAHREDALATQRTQRQAARSASHCYDCGDPIPDERRKAVPGVTLCVDCQLVQEHAQGLERRTHA